MNVLGTVSDKKNSKLQVRVQTFANNKYVVSASPKAVGIKQYL